MSKYEQRDNTGSLFKNIEKRNERGPDYSGTCLIAGVEYFFDGWIKQKEGGRAWMSFSFKAKDKQPEQSAGKTVGEMHRERTAAYQAPATKPSTGFDDMPDDIPF